MGMLEHEFLIFIQRSEEERKRTNFDKEFDYLVVLTCSNNITTELINPSVFSFIFQSEWLCYVLYYKEAFDPTYDESVMIKELQKVSVIIIFL